VRGQSLQRRAEAVAGPRTVPLQQAAQEAVQPADDGGVGETLGLFQL
jgi:hypothetical protein